MTSVGIAVFVGVTKSRLRSCVIASSVTGLFVLLEGRMLMMMVGGRMCWFNRKASLTNLLNRFLSWALPNFFDTVIPTLGLELKCLLVPCKKSATKTFPYTLFPFCERRLYSVLFVTRSRFGNEKLVSVKEIVLDASELLATLTATTVNDFTTIGSFHPFPEAVVLFSVDFARLVGSFHVWQPLSKRMRADFRQFSTFQTRFFLSFL